MIEVEAKTAGLNTDYGELIIPYWVAKPLCAVDAPVSLISPAFGVKGHAVEDAAYYLASLTRRRVIGYQQDYGRYVGDPTKNLSGFVVSTIGAVMRREGLDVVDLVGQSAGTFTQGAVLGLEPERVNDVVLVSGAGISWPKRMAGCDRQELAGLPIDERIYQASNLPQANVMALQLAARFTASSLRSMPGMLARDRRALRQSVSGFNREITANMMSWYEGRPALAGAFLVAGTLDITPELKQARRSGHSVWAVHGEDDTVFPLEEVQAGIAGGGVLDYLSVIEGGHEFINTRVGRRGLDEAARLLIHGSMLGLSHDSQR